MCGHYRYLKDHVLAIGLTDGRVDGRSLTTYRTAEHHAVKAMVAKF